MTASLQAVYLCKTRHGVNLYACIYCSMKADHDGYDSATSCQTEDRYVMAPSVALFTSQTDYSVNPWRFSYCSVENFKSYIAKLDRRG